VSEATKTAVGTQGVTLLAGSVAVGAGGTLSILACAADFDAGVVNDFITSIACQAIAGLLMAVSRIGCTCFTISRGIGSESDLAFAAFLKWLIAELAIQTGARLTGIWRSKDDGFSGEDQAGVSRCLTQYPLYMK
jgi:hypothetical protein